MDADGSNGTLVGRSIQRMDNVVVSVLFRC
jgi:hypothetical protein